MHGVNNVITVWHISVHEKYVNSKLAISECLVGNMVKIEINNFFTTQSDFSKVMVAAIQNQPTTAVFSSWSAASLEY